MSGDNIHSRASGFRECRACRRIHRKAAQQKRRRLGKEYLGFSAAKINMVTTREVVESAFEAVRENGRLLDARQALGGEWKAGAFFHFNPRIFREIKKLTFRTPRIITSPAIIITDAHRNERLLNRIKAAVAVPRWLSRDDRQQLVSDIYFEVFAGSMKQCDIEVEAKKLARKRHSLIKYAPPSLDRPKYRDSAAPEVDFIASDAPMWEYVP
jgi:hypothetical protein